MSKFKHRLLIIMLSILAVVLVLAYATGLLGVVVEEVVWRLSNIYWKPL
jgi:flagellar basal body-associated protein FliL